MFELGGIQYLANSRHPKAVLEGDCSKASSESVVPLTVVYTAESSMDAAYLEGVLGSFAREDDVYSEDFLHALYIRSESNSLDLDASVLSMLDSLSIPKLFVTPEVRVPSGDHQVTVIQVQKPSVQPASGPYAAVITQQSVSLGAVYRLYEDSYKTFLYGTYDSNDGSGTWTEAGRSKGWNPLIPVPSRIYNFGDTRPLAGKRVGVKDLYGMKGLVTSGGSIAYAQVMPVQTENAPSIQRLIDQGAVLVGKQKLAQFASGANPWDWYDEQYPFNPRGDGWLTCSASSAGGGCSIAAYDWLDYAIGSDTGSSMRRPAAVSGTYGNRPSQGFMSLEGVMPLGGSTDTAGVFSRSPYDWVKFARAWYTPELYQDTNTTGLEPLVVPPALTAWPSTILYPVDYLPLNNSAAQPVLEEFIAGLQRVFGMQVREFNFTESILTASDPVARNVSAFSGATSVIAGYSQWTTVGEPLVREYGAKFDGRFPPIDPSARSGWLRYANATSGRTPYTYAEYVEAQAVRKYAADWYDSEIQPSSDTQCSESIMLNDIGTGGKPSFRERDLNEDPAASYLATKKKNTLMTEANICPIYACADYTIPIGQVEYVSPITQTTEMVPVTINIIVRRGCDGMLFDLVEKLADEGVLKTVKTGRVGF
ncbi:amidase family protein [Eremomyces bilateralis CBS 781.70]|uniref:Amidase family protein n=1 Tax=Eremomyces bilateralis CBS 781.70 TaxID=1392243 RepID=A0A6G1FR53_9PEZI|nr:amidase family protein [Eremomyces bilateralis CBS 781.70]KAF1808169.1 amidase family protein [Eremomyces bilateralis CBS 781.70]